MSAAHEHEATFSIVDRRKTETYKPPEVQDRLRAIKGTNKLLPASVIPFISRSEPADRRDWIAHLAGALPFASVKDFAECTEAERRTARVAIVANPDPTDVVQCPNLVWVQSLWAGVERLVAELPHGDLKIVRMVDPQLADTMAEAVLAWTLYLHRDMPTYQRQQVDRVWRQVHLPTAAERHVGLVGFGTLGRRATTRLTNNDFAVKAWDLVPQEQVGVTTFTGVEGLHAMAAESDILVILLPLTEETRGLVNRSIFSKMKSGAALMNFARGPLIVEQDLIDALDAGQLSHAVLDVFDVEPLPVDHIYWRHPKVTVLPHISAPTNRRTASAIAANNITRFLTEGFVPMSVDRVRGF